MPSLSVSCTSPDSCRLRDRSRTPEPGWNEQRLRSPGFRRSNWRVCGCGHEARGPNRSQEQVGPSNAFVVCCVALERQPVAGVHADNDDTAGHAGFASRQTRCSAASISAAWRCGAACDQRPCTSANGHDGGRQRCAQRRSGGGQRERRRERSSLRIPARSPGGVGWRGAAGESREALAARRPCGPTRPAQPYRWRQSRRLRRTGHANRAASAKRGLRDGTARRCRLSSTGLTATRRGDRSSSGRFARLRKRAHGHAPPDLEQRLRRRRCVGARTGSYRRSNSARVPGARIDDLRTDQGAARRSSGVLPVERAFFTISVRGTGRQSASAATGSMARHVRSVGVIECSSPSGVLSELAPRLARREAGQRAPPPEERGWSSRRFGCGRGPGWR